MTQQLKIFLLIGIFIYVLAILLCIKKNKISLKYALLWFFSTLILLVMVLFPNLVYAITDFLGIYSPVNVIFIAFIFLILLILISITTIVTKQNQQIKKLTQSIALLEKEINQIKILTSQVNYTNQKYF